MGGGGSYPHRLLPKHFGDYERGKENAKDEVGIPADSAEGATAAATQAFLIQTLRGNLESEDKFQKILFNR